MSENPQPCHSIGIQWGLWVWSDSQYKWLGGTGGGVSPPPPPPPPPSEFSDDFNDNSLDTDKWVKKKFQKITTIDVYERSQRLEVALGQDDLQLSPKAGVRTKNTTPLKDKTIIVDVYVPFDGVDYSRLYCVVTPEDIPENISQSPEAWLYENSKKGYSLGTQPKAVWAQKIINGVITGLGTKYYTEETWNGKLRIVWTGSTITFQCYRGGGWSDIASDTCMFGDAEELYVYLWAEDNWARSVSHAKTDIWYDNFSIT